MRSKSGDLPGLSLNGLALSSDGSTVVLSSGLDVRLLDHTGTAIHHVTLSMASVALAISGDGRRVAYGTSNELHVLQEQGGTWLETFSVLGNATELPARAGLSLDGEVLGVAWWESAGGVGLRLEIWDTGSKACLNHHDLPGVRWWLAEHG